MKNYVFTVFSIVRTLQNLFKWMFMQFQWEPAVAGFWPSSTISFTYLYLKFYWNVK
jgi:hypothetical protein